MIRVIVLRLLPATENNAVLHLLSATPQSIRYAVSHYRQRSAETSTLIYKVFKGFKREGIDMPYTMKDFRRDFVREDLKDFTPEERLQGLSLEECLRGFSAEQIEQYLKRSKKAQPARKRKKNG